MLGLGLNKAHNQNSILVPQVHLSNNSCHVIPDGRIAVYCHNNTRRELRLVLLLLLLYCCYIVVTVVLLLLYGQSRIILNFGTYRYQTGLSKRQTGRHLKNHCRLESGFPDLELLLSHGLFEGKVKIQNYCNESCSKSLSGI